MYSSVTVAVGCTILQEQAVTNPSSARTRLAGLEEAGISVVGVPFVRTDSTIEEAIDSTCAAAAASILRLTDADGVMVAVSMIVVVVRIRSVLVCVVVVDALVVTVLPLPLVST